MWVDISPLLATCDDAMELQSISKLLVTAKSSLKDFSASLLARFTKTVNSGRGTSCRLLACREDPGRVPGELDVQALIECTHKIVLSLAGLLEEAESRDRWPMSVVWCNGSIRSPGDANVVFHD